MSKAKRLIKNRSIPKDRTTYTRPEGAGNFDNMDDKNIVDQINIKVGTVDIEPRVDKEIANKKYVDDEIIAKHIPAGSDGEVQFNDSGAFGADNDFFWDNVNKRLGIGTTTPFKTFHIKTDDETSMMIQSANGKKGVLIFRDVAGQRAQIMSAVANDLRFFTDGVDTSDEKMRILDSGNVGIGTTTPTSSLHVSESAGGAAIVAKFENRRVSTTAEARMQFIAQTATTNFQQFSSSHATDPGLFRISAANPGEIQFLTGGTNRMTILQDGKIGIGTSSPNEKLHVLGTARFGDASNYTDIQSDGEINLVGTARVKHGLWFDATGMKTPGTKPATYVDHGISGAWEFSNGTDDTIVFNLRIPEDMDRTADPSLIIGWCTNTAVTTETCVWQLEYLLTSPGDDTTAAAQGTVTINSNAISQSNGLITAEISGLDAPSDTDVCVHCRLKRLGADADDDLTDTALLMGVCLQYTSNKLGLSL